MDVKAINEHISSIHEGRKWILTTDVATAANGLATTLKDDHASGIMVVAGGEGVGDLPDVDRIHYTRTSGEGIMGALRSFQTSIEEPSEALVRAVDSFDPQGEAMVLGAGFTRRRQLVCRQIYGARRPEWRAFEDKMLVDELWDTAGIERVPSAVVAISEAPRVADELERGLGTVWTADNKDGWHGGGEYTRWMRSGDDHAETVNWFQQHAGSVRVMPFLEGLPCSIHGFATDNGVAVFRPVELFVLRERKRPRFFYAQAANFWSPPEHVTAQMRSAASLVGSELRRRVGYRGGFGIDGILTAEGFRPTELNPRLTIGHGLQARTVGLPLGSMERLMFEGDLSIDAEDLETTVMAGTREQRGGGMLFPLNTGYPKDSADFAFTPHGAVAVDDETQSDGAMMIGPAAFGSVIIVRLDPERTPVGPSLTPRTKHVLDLARSLWSIDAPEVDVAIDLTSQGPGPSSGSPASPDNSAGRKT